MVHRDVKPGNIVCGANGTVFLTDFGIVRVIGRTRLTQHGTIGTVSYLAPEQVRGPNSRTHQAVDSRADVARLRPAPVRRNERRGVVWLAAAGVLTTALIVAVLVWLLPRDGSNFKPGQPAPTASAWADRLRQDLRDLQSAVQP